MIVINVGEKSGMTVVTGLNWVNSRIGNRRKSRLRGKDSF